MADTGTYGARSAALHIDTGADHGAGKGKGNGKGAGAVTGHDAVSSISMAEQPLMEWFLYALFTCIVAVSIIVVVYGIASGYAVLQVHPAVLLVLLVGTLTLLGYVEALHYSNVAIERYDMTPYAEK
jgi:hypothetical protein